jgi:hypothetical protein
VSGRGDIGKAGRPSGAVTDAAAPVRAAPVDGRVAAISRRPVRRGLLSLALVLLGAAVIVELVAGPALRPARSANHARDVLALSGVAAMAHDAQIDPTEIAQVASRQHQPAPLAVSAEALLDGLLLVAAGAVALPRLVPRRNMTRYGRLSSFLVALAILLVGIAVAVKAIARLRYLDALYISPPAGTLSYLLLYGSFRRGGSLVALTGLMALKLAAIAALYWGYPRAASERGLPPLALTSVAATVAVAMAYALVPSSLASITDALAAAVVALVAILWAGVIVSGTVRRLA